MVSDKEVKSEGSCRKSDACYQKCFFAAPKPLQQSIEADAHVPPPDTINARYLLLRLFLTTRPTPKAMTNAHLSFSKTPDFIIVSSERFRTTLDRSIISRALRISYSSDGSLRVGISGCGSAEPSRRK